MRAGKLFAVAALAAIFAAPLDARATRLDALAGSSRSIGDLGFAFTQLGQTGRIVLHDVDSSLVTDRLGVGFDIRQAIAGALAVASGALRDLELEFRVTSTLGVDGVANHLAVAVSQILANTAIPLDVQSRTALLARISEVERTYAVAPVPEPGAFAIFAASIGLITAASRRRWL